MLTKGFINTSQGLFSVVLTEGEHTVTLQGFGLKIRKNFAEGVSADKANTVFATQGVNAETIIATDEKASALIAALTLAGINPQDVLWQFAFISSPEMQSKPQIVPSAIKEVGKSYPIVVRKEKWETTDRKGNVVVREIPRIFMPETAKTEQPENVAIAEGEEG